MGHPGLAAGFGLGEVRLWQKGLEGGGQLEPSGSFDCAQDDGRTLQARGHRDDGVRAV
jgi:hypothetical protein